MDRLIRFLFLGQLLTKLWRNTMMFAAALWGGLVWLVKALATAFLTFWAHIPALCSRFADMWLDKATNAGFPTIWAPTLYYLLWGLAFLMMLLAWVVCSYATITFLRVLF